MVRGGFVGGMNVMNGDGEKGGGRVAERGEEKFDSFLPTFSHLLSIKTTLNLKKPYKTAKKNYKWEIHWRDSVTCEILRYEILKKVCGGLGIWEGELKGKGKNKTYISTNKLFLIDETSSQS